MCGNKKSKGHIDNINILYILPVSDDVYIHLGYIHQTPSLPGYIVYKQLKTKLEWRACVRGHNVSLPCHLKQTVFGQILPLSIDANACLESYETGLLS